MTNQMFAVAFDPAARFRCTMAGVREPTAPFTQPWRVREDLPMYFVTRGSIELADKLPEGNYISVDTPGILHVTPPGVAQASHSPFMPGSAFAWLHIESEAGFQTLNKEEAISIMEAQLYSRRRDLCIIPRRWDMLDQLANISALHEHLFNQMAVWGTGDAGVEACARHICFLIHAHLARNLHRLIDPSQKSERGRRLTLKALRYLQERQNEFWTCDGVARECKCSAVYLNRCFREQTGQTLSHHLIGQRISIAKKLLRQGQMTPKEVAFACGYASLNYFCRQFKQQAGMTARLWQKQAITNQSL